MLSFLEETLEHLISKHHNVSSLTIIVPSKRAGGFLKNCLRQLIKQTAFSPKIISIEEFIEEISGIKIINSSELLFRSYEAYLNTSTPLEKDSFDIYSTWANTILNDINEIDRFLVPSEQFFNYLSSIQNMNHWYLQDEKTPLIKNYLKFWDSLYGFYLTLKELLLKSNIGYQGLVYRKAAEDIEHYISVNEDSPHVFIGFNALNKAEQTIIQELLEAGNTEIYWDAETTFYKDENHSASLFIRKYVSEWNYYKDHTPEFISNHYSKEKKFNFIETQKDIGQVKYIGNSLSRLSKDELNKTVVVLGDEHLLIPLLHSLPLNVESVNVTMGANLRSFPLTVFLELLLVLHKKNSKAFYYQDLLSILNHPIASLLLSNGSLITSRINQDNLSHLSFGKLTEISDKNDLNMIDLLFGNWDNNSSIAISKSLDILLLLKGVIQKDRIEYVVNFEMFQIFQRIETLNNSYQYLKTISEVHQLFSELISNTTLDFKGDAYHGLQIMGVLETRVLDFENIYITSVNEGILPSGKSNASFITYDLKRQFGMPLYSEKDAIYTYHFYRLLHRAKMITLLYSTVSEGLNSGEKSRFISQLEIEKLDQHHYEKILVSPDIPNEDTQLRSIRKTGTVIERLKEIAEKGFSPSSLTSYMRNPLDFYYQKILRLNDFQEVEETVAAKTLGTIVHDTLEAFYTPLENQILTVAVLSDMKKETDTEVRKQFERSFKEGTFSKGKNLIIYEVAKRYILNFINYEIQDLKKGNQIKILKIESDLEAMIPIKELNFPVKIHGKIDRLDEYNGQLRIIDYKTGLVKQNDVELIDWDEITKDYKYSKPVQILAYALMIHEEIGFDQACAGIISFKNLNSGFLKFGTKTSSRSKRDQIIDKQVLDRYVIELKKLIIELCDPTIPFKEKEV